MIKKLVSELLISEKVNLRTSKINYQGQNCFIVIKESFHQEDISLQTLYAAKNRTPYKANLTELKRKLDKSTITVDFYATISVIGEQVDKKVNRNLKA